MAKTELTYSAALDELKEILTRIEEQNVSQFPLPILSGIGHDKDESVVDVVAHQFFKTPTAVANFLVDKLGEFDGDLDDCVVFIDLCPSDSLIISIGIPWYLAFVAQECRMVYELTGDFRFSSLDRLFN